MAIFNWFSFKIYANNTYLYYANYVSKEPGYIVNCARLPC